MSKKGVLLWQNTTRILNSYALMHTRIESLTGSIRFDHVSFKYEKNGPKILIFDEAASALDNKTQKHVSEAINTLNCTRIVIAHRLPTINNW